MLMALLSLSQILMLSIAGRYSATQKLRLLLSPDPVTLHSIWRFVQVLPPFRWIRTYQGHGCSRDLDGIC